MAKRSIDPLDPTTLPCGACRKTLHQHTTDQLAACVDIMLNRSPTSLTRQNQVTIRIKDYKRESSLSLIGMAQGLSDLGHPEAADQLRKMDIEIQRLVSKHLPRWCACDNPGYHDPHIPFGS